MATTCNFGQIPDIRVKSLCLKGKKVIDENCNINAANVKAGNVIVRNNLFTGNIIERDALQGITVCGNLMIKDEFSFQISTLFTTKISLPGIIPEGNISANIPDVDFEDMITFCGDINAMDSRVYAGNVLTNNISAANIEEMIVVCGNINASKSSVYVENLLTNEITAANTEEMIIVSGNVNALDSSVYVGNLITQKISPVDSSNAIVFCGDICVQADSRIQTDLIEAKDPLEGLLVNCMIPKKRYGVARTHFGEGVFDILDVDEDIETTINDVIYNFGLIPMANTFQSILPGDMLVEAFPDSNPDSYHFRSPPTLPNCSYSNCFVEVSAAVKIEITDSVDGAPVQLVLAKRSFPTSGFANIDETDIIFTNGYNHKGDTGSTGTGLVTLSINDIVDMQPDEVLELHIGLEAGGLLEGNVLSGSECTKISYKVVSFE